MLHNTVYKLFMYYFQGKLSSVQQPRSIQHLTVTKYQKMTRFQYSYQCICCLYDSLVWTQGLRNRFRQSRQWPVAPEVRRGPPKNSWLHQSLHSNDNFGGTCLNFYYRLWSETFTLGPRLGLPYIWGPLTKVPWNHISFIYAIRDVLIVMILLLI